MIIENNSKQIIKENYIRTNELENESSLLAELIKPVVDSMESITETIEYFKIVGEQVSQAHQSYKAIIESIQETFNLISNITFPKIDIDFRKLKIYFYKAEFEKNKYIVNRLYNHTIFPPISYIAEKCIEDSKIQNLEEWILNDNELKLFYSHRINKWKDKYTDTDINRMISEIKFNFENSNSYSVCTLIYILIEYMLRQNYSDKIGTNGNIYTSIKSVLKEKAFKPINIKKLYIRFIEKNLYASTDKAIEFSRHMTHGERIEFGNMKSAMNMIFIYDFLQDIMIIVSKSS